MASIYVKNKILYLSWWDPEENKTRNRSLKMKDTTANRKRAQKMSKLLQKKLDGIKDTMDEQALSGATIREAFEHFKNNNHSKHPKTIKDYDRFYKKFSDQFEPNASCKIINKISAENWINDIKKLPLQQNSKHAYVKQLNHFLNFLFEYEYVPLFRINKDVKTKPEVKEKITFADEDLYKIFDNLKGKNINFRTAVYLLFYTGLRSSDVLQISIENIDLEHRVLKYYSPKRKKHREVGFHTDLVELLKNSIGKKTVGSLLNYKSVANLSKAMSKYLEKLGLKGKNYSARTFRKTFITLCRSRYYMDASVVRELVGHEHNNTTDKYYNEITPLRMQEELLKFKRPMKEK